MYKRLTKDYNMEIDFVNNICTFIFDNKEKCSIDIESKIEINTSNINIKYKIDDDTKSILIVLKEE